jgi:hypothetical protein
MKAILTKKQEIPTNLLEKLTKEVILKIKKAFLIKIKNRILVKDYKNKTEKTFFDSRKYSGYHVNILLFEKSSQY